MKDIVLIVIHLAVTVAKLLGPGGMRAVVAENVLLKQQLIVLRRPRRRAPNLTVMDRFVFGTARREYLDHVLFWNRRDLERKLSDFQAFYNVARVHASLDGNTPLGVTVGETVKRAELDDVRWVSHCRGLVQLPIAA